MYVVVSWPDSQNLMCKPGFRENSYLVNDDKGIEDFGGSAYFVDVDWLQSVEESSTPEADAIWEDVRDACYSVYGELDLRDEKKFTEEITLTNGNKAIGFYVEEDNDPLIVVITDNGENPEYGIYDLPAEDAGDIADAILIGDYE